MKRVERLRELLDKGRYFKIVCGAGNEDPEEVRRLTTVYTLAGALGIDISANLEVVRACVAGIDRAVEAASRLGWESPERPFINVSVGLKGDPHVRKARIDEALCTQCGMCLEVCEQEAIDGTGFQVIQHRCIGCGNCSEACPSEAVGFFTRKVDFAAILPQCLEAGAENIELHAIIADDGPVLEDWRLISRVVPEQFISMCLDRSELSNKALLKRIASAREMAGDRFIVQADGAPMSGGSDDFNTTLQAIATADVVQKSGLPVKILLSGGTNGRTGELAALCGLTVHGVSIGTFARKLVREEVKAPEFDEDPALLARAVNRARELVDKNLQHIRRD